MNITDYNGKRVEIDNLDLALMQADDYRHYRISRPEQYPLGEMSRIYWEDRYQKLVKLKAEQQ